MNPHNNNPRFVTSFRVAGTKSFRLAAGKLFGEYGGNAQNPAKPLLKALVARNGYTFVQPDQSGAEALVVAHLTRPGNYRALFANGIKPHTFLALHIFGSTKPHWFEELPTPLDKFLATTNPADLVNLPGWPALSARIEASDVTEPDRPYMCGKRTAHARSYCMGARTFQEAMLKDTQGTMVLSYKQAQHFLSTFDWLFPEVIEWQTEVTLMAKACGELRNLLGFPRKCHQIFTNGYERELVSWIPQSTVGCITHEGVLKFRALKTADSRYRDWHLLNNKHDSMLLEVPDAAVAHAVDLAKTFMAVDLVGSDGVQFRMKSDVQVGKVWAPSKVKTDTLGMQKYTRPS